MTPHDFAVDVVKKLKTAGFEAFWVGGCVRDLILGTAPKDYDVATNAKPWEVRNLFGHKRTIGIGAAFGVILLHGTKDSGDIEIATFRKDGPYINGRHPSGVVFCTPEEDSRRRDFTINGLFLDPVGGSVLDFVGGQHDIASRVIRAIGNPIDRFREDRLRMLRAVRFAVTLGFDIDPATEAAINPLAAEVSLVSPERISQELRRMLVSEGRVRGLEILRSTGLLSGVLPEVTDDRLESVSKRLQALTGASFVEAMSLLLGSTSDIDQVSQQLRLSNNDKSSIEWLLQRVLSPKTDDLAWVKKSLASPLAGSLVRLLTATEQSLGSLATPFSPEEIDPPPLLTGEDLIQLGLKPGPEFREMLDAARDAQLRGGIRTKGEALSKIELATKEKGT